MKNRKRFFNEGRKTFAIIGDGDCEKWYFQLLREIENLTINILPQLLKKASLKKQYEDVKKDILNWLPKVKTGGIIAGHDFQDAFTGTMQAVREILGEPEILGKDTSWGFVKK